MKKLVLFLIILIPSTVNAILPYRIPSNCATQGSTIDTDFVYMDQNKLDVISGVDNYSNQTIGGNKIFLGNAYFSGTGNNYFAGNVGIGTAGPGQNLEIYKAGADNSIRINDSSHYWDWTHYTADNRMAFLEDGSAKLTITSGGNVGIGTTSPGSVLDVSTNQSVAGTNFYPLIRAQNINSGVQRGATLGSYGDGNAAIDVWQADTSSYGGFLRLCPAGGGVLVGGTRQTATISPFDIQNNGNDNGSNIFYPYLRTVSLNSSVYRGACLGSYNGNAAIDVWQTDSGTYGGFLQLNPKGGAVSTGGTLSVAGNSYFAGSVGIGTTNPGVNLEIYKAKDNSIRINDTSHHWDWTHFTFDNRMAFLEDGSAKLAIATSGIVTMPHYGAGAATFDASGNISSVSDERLKTNIKPFQRGLSDVLKISPIIHKYTKESGLDTENYYPGFSAQNIKTAIPEAVFEKNSTLSIYDRGIMAALVNAIKEQQEEIAYLKLEIKKLKK